MANFEFKKMILAETSEWSMKTGNIIPYSQVKRTVSSSLEMLLCKKKNAETAYLKSNKLLPFGFTRILESSNPSPRL